VGFPRFPFFIWKLAFDCSSSDRRFMGILHALIHGGSDGKERKQNRMYVDVVRHLRFYGFCSPNIEIVYDPEFDYEDYYWALSGWNFGGMSSGHVQTWRFGIAYLNVSNLTALDGLAAKFSRAVCLMDGSKRIL
jgi:hypothetical protein